MWPNGMERVSTEVTIGPHPPEKTIEKLNHKALWWDAAKSMVHDCPERVSTEPTLAPPFLHNFLRF